MQATEVRVVDYYSLQLQLTAMPIAHGLRGGCEV